MLSVSALFFQSCLKDEGQVFRSPGDLSSANTEYLDTFSVFMETYQMDSLLSSGREFLLAGSYDDGVLGKISTVSYFQFLPDFYPQVCPDSIMEEYTKATLILNNARPYGKFGTDQFGLYRLSENLNGDRSHYSGEVGPASESTPYLTTLNASRTEKAIRIDAGKLGQEIISFWKEKKVLSDDQQFLERFRGFALKSLESVRQVTRFDLQYRDDAAPAFLQVSYRLRRGNEQPEEKFLRFRTDRNTVQYYTIKADYDSTAFAGIPAGGGLPVSQTGQLAAVQEGGALSTKLRIPGLNRWKASRSEKIKVFKAELEIRPQDPSSLPPPDFLRIHSREDYENPVEADLSQAVLNESQILALLQQGYPSRTLAANAIQSRLFPYDAAKNVYRCNITAHVQDWLDGKVSSECLNLYGSQWTISVNRMLLPPGSVKLRLYYFPF